MAFSQFFGTSKKSSQQNESIESEEEIIVTNAVFEDLSLQEGLLDNFLKQKSNDQIEKLSNDIVRVKRDISSQTLDRDISNERLNEIDKMKKIADKKGPIHHGASDVIEEDVRLYFYWALNSDKLTHEKSSLEDKINSLNESIKKLNEKQVELEKALELELRQQHKSPKNNRLRFYQSNSVDELDHYFYQRAKEHEQESTQEQDDQDNQDQYSSHFTIS